MEPVIASLAFMKNNAPDTLKHGRGVFQGLTGNTGFGTLPPGALTTLDGSLTSLETAIGKTATGGTAETEIQEQQRVGVNQQLHKLAIHCQENCNNDPAVFATSGFTQAKIGGPSTPLPKCSIRTVTNGASTQLIVEAETMANARSWEARWWVGTNPPQHADCLKPNRKMTIINLPSGQMINIQMRAHGGSTGFSDWSDTVQHMAM
jgi:hypothetical protein